MANRTTTQKKKPGAEGARRRATRGRKARRPTVRLVPKLPERFVEVPLVRRAVAELEKREDTLNDALERFTTAYADLSERIVDLEKNARGEAERRAVELFDRVRGTELQGRALDELDELLDRVGLLRKAKHLEELEAAKKRARAAGRRAAQREAAEREQGASDE